MSPSRVLKTYFKDILRQKHLVYITIALSGISLVLWLIHEIPVGWHGTYVLTTDGMIGVLLYALVLFFGFETIYRISQRLWPARFRNNRRLNIFALGAVLSWTLVISYASGFACGYLRTCLFVDVIFWATVLGFLSIYFIGAVGGIGIVRTVSDGIASRVEITRIWHFVFVFAGILGLYFALEWIGGFIEVGIGTVGIGISLLAGLGYLVYLVRRKDAMYHSQNLVYFTLFLALAGIFIGYQYHNLNMQAQEILLVTNGSPITSLDISRTFVLPLTLIAVGYVDLLITIPGTVEKKVRAQEERISPPLTFFMLSVVAAVYFQSITTYGAAGVGSFSFLSGLAQFYGLIFGTVIAAPTIMILRSKRVRLARLHRKAQLCKSCNSPLERGAKFCGGCGRPLMHKLVDPPTPPDRKETSLDTSRDELFKGEGQIVLKQTRVHSVRRKVLCLIAGGPLGYLLFGRNEIRKSKAEGPLVVTRTSINCEGNDYPISAIAKLTKRRGAASINLSLAKDGALFAQRFLGPVTEDMRFEARLRARDPEGLLSAIEKARTNGTAYQQVVGI